jgi:UDP-2-acetamido-2,6-beta-L-arabino-hexul-4-ose reductase
MTNVGVTGARGFIGSNLMVRLAERSIPAIAIPHEASDAELDRLLSGVDIVIHLAGVNRPPSNEDFASGNAGFTRRVADALLRLERSTPLLLASSIQAGRDTPYGQSKLAAEAVIADYTQAGGAGSAILRLPNVFGKWCRPNYNSVVSTFCHNIARGLPIRIDDPASMLRLVYIDDLLDHILAWIERGGGAMANVTPVYEVTLGDLAARIAALKASRDTLMPGPVGTGLMRALHATYLSGLDPADFAYRLKSHTDQRGSFAEMLRTEDAGQVSVFTAHPGVTRGGHYHHSKTEKFLVVSGTARFCFRHIVTGETAERITSDQQLEVVETVPGWSHDITNIGSATLVVMLWANERFDPARPDTVAAPVR